MTAIVTRHGPSSTPLLTTVSRTIQLAALRATGALGAATDCSAGSCPPASSESSVSR